MLIINILHLVIFYVLISVLAVFRYYFKYDSNFFFKHLLLNIVFKIDKISFVIVLTFLFYIFKYSIKFSSRMKNTDDF